MGPLAVVLLLAEAASAPAKAAPWKHIAHHEKPGGVGASVYIDPHRVTRKGDQVDYWDRVTLDAAQVVAPDKPAVKENEMHIRVDCKTMTATPLSQITYGEGRVVLSKRTMHAAAQPVPPGSGLYDEVSYVCTHWK